MRFILLKDKKFLSSACSAEIAQNIGKIRPRMSPPSESPARIEPCQLDTVPPALADSIADLVEGSARLGARLNPRTARSLADLVAIMNCFYSNLIEGHHTRPRDIERALADDFDKGPRRNLQLEARAHIRVQREIELLFADDNLGEPAACEFIRRLHRRFYEDAPEELLTTTSSDGRTTIRFVPGEFRKTPQEDVVVGRHVPPSSAFVESFMRYFEDRYSFHSIGRAQQIVAMAASHHRFNYIHPFPDGNGRVSRLMSHAMALKAGIGAHGLWSISRGLARGLSDRSEYKVMMDATDTGRTNDTDGRGNLSLRALEEFVGWFCNVARDQVAFMASLFDFDTLRGRLREYVLGPLGQHEDAAALVDEVFLRGLVPRGEAERITKRSERSARDVLRKLLNTGLLHSATPNGNLFLRFSSTSADFLFPRLFPIET